MHQLSRISLLVPVLTADQYGVESGFSRPHVTARAPRSETMSDRMTAASLELSCFEGAFPSRCRRVGSLHLPPVASVLYAFTSSYRVTSAEPTRREKPESQPSRRSSHATFGR